MVTPPAGCKILHSAHILHKFYCKVKCKFCKRAGWFYCAVKSRTLRLCAGERRALAPGDGIQRKKSVRSAFAREVLLHSLHLTPVYLSNPMMSRCGASATRPSSERRPRSAQPSFFFCAALVLCVTVVTTVTSSPSPTTLLGKFCLTETVSWWALTRVLISCGL